MFLAFLLAGLLLPEMPADYRVNQESAIGRAATVSIAAFPDADMVTIANSLHIEYAPDGTYTEWEETWTKVLTEKGRRALRSITHNVSERYGKAEIQHVELIDKNGKRRVVDFRKTLKVATDNTSEGSNIYDPLDKIIRCGVPELKIGDTLCVVICDRLEKPRIRNAFAARSCFENVYPVMEDSFSIIQPDNKPIQSIKLRNPIGNTVQRDQDRPLGDGRTLLKWTARNVPQAFPEPAMPAFYSVAQSINVSTLRDWREVSTWYWQLCEGHLAQTNAALVAKAHEIAAAEKTREAKVRALFAFVAQEIRYVGLTLEEESPGYAPHDVAVTFENRAGVCRDKAALLVAMLRAVGIEAYPVLIMVGPKIDPDVPSTAFNHAITAVREGDGYWLMDPTAETTKDMLPAWLANRSYLVAHPQGETLRTSPVPPAIANALRINTVGAINTDGSAITTTSFDFGGVNDNIYRGALLKYTPDMRRSFFESIIRGASAGAELLSLKVEPKDLRDTSKPLKAVVTARLPGIVLRGNTRDEIFLPFQANNVGAASCLFEGVTALEKRRFPLVRSFTTETEESIRLELNGVTGKLQSLPPAFAENAGGFSLARNYYLKDTVLEVTNRITSNSVEYSPEEYLKLRTVRKAAETAAREKPIFTARDAAADADTRILSLETEIGLSSPRSWVITNTYEKEILTYNGKTSAAELKLAWQPRYETLNLIYASVSNRDGRVQVASPKDMSTLDADGAASAPRYPAGKRLIVNLPGVTVGSVIRVKTVRTVNGAPTDFSDMVFFDSTTPVSYRRYDVRSAVPFLLAGRNQPHLVTNYFTRIERNIRPLKHEPNTPHTLLWRDWVILTTANYETYANELSQALKDAREAGSEKATARALELTANAETPEAKIKAIRDELFKRVRVSGPGIFALPFNQAFFPPDRSLTDGYASGTDWMNLYFAMLKAVGLEPEFILSDRDRGALPLVRKYRESLPRANCFNELLIRVTVNQGGFLGFGGENQTFYLDYENEYTPVGTTAFSDTRILQLADSTFSTLPYAGNEQDSRDLSKTTITLRETGEADFDIALTSWGHSIGGTRRTYSEMLPEMRDRHYRTLLNAISENASATSELETDTTGYPFTLHFKAYADGYATIRNDVMSITTGTFQGAIFGVGGPERHNPIIVPMTDPEECIREYIFPTGYTEIEHLPPSYELPEGVRCKVSTCFRDGHLVVTLHYHLERFSDRIYGAEMFNYFREINRRATSAEARTIAIRKP